ncbi:MAG TPA: hypothetical protein VFE01_08880, partial [Terracidiphilus sp.]|nr:hypothetical protein [Terracidiphilus sp.]
MSGATEHQSDESHSGLTRREAMLQLLRLGGVAAGAAGMGAWLSERSARPMAARAEEALRDHRVAVNPQLPKLTVVQDGEPRALVQQ